MKKKFSLITFIGLILGIAFGLLLPEHVDKISIVGTEYVTILKFFIVPVVFTSIACTIYNTSKLKNHLVGKSVLAFIIMYTITFLLTSLLVWLINPSSGFAFDKVEWSGNTTKFEILEVIKNLFPKNLDEVFKSPKVFAFILIAYVFGKLCAVLKLEKVIGVVETIKKWLFKILEIFMYVTPLAVFSLIATTIVKNGPTLIGVGLKYIICAWVCGLFTLVLVMILPCLLVAGVKPIDYIKKASPIWLMTLTTCSSAACLPNTVKTCNEEFGIPEEVTDVAVPLGCTIHMCGGAVSFALLGLFSASLYGIEINFVTYLLMLLSSLLINMAAPGIPNGGIVIGASYLQLFGIPLDFIGFYSGIYKFLDMCYTTLNVTGDVTANVILNQLVYKNKD